MRQSIGEPDPFRLRYRDLLSDTVAALVRAAMNKQQAIAQIHERAERAMPEADRSRVIERAETEALSLHEGNMARYRLRPSDFERWRAA